MHLIKPILKFLTVFLLIFFITPGMKAQDKWKFVTEKDGIKVYSRYTADSKVKALQVKCTINSSVPEIVALLMDLEAATEWVSHTKSCKLVKQVSQSELYYYSEVDLPWPLENRDFVARIRVIQDPVTGIVTVDAPAVGGLVPVRDGIVRIAKSTGFWVLTALDAKTTQVQYTLHVDPGGAIPAWLVNSLAAQGPIDSFLGMKEQLKRQKYKNVQLPFLKINELK